LHLLQFVFKTYEKHYLTNKIFGLGHLIVPYEEDSTLLFLTLTRNITDALAVSDTCLIF